MKRFHFDETSDCLFTFFCFFCFFPQCKILKILLKFTVTEYFHDFCGVTVVFCVHSPKLLNIHRVRGANVSEQMLDYGDFWFCGKKKRL